MHRCARCRHSPSALALAVGVPRRRRRSAASGQAPPLPAHPVDRGHAAPACSPSRSPTAAPERRAAAPRPVPGRRPATACPATARPGGAAVRRRPGPEHAVRHDLLLEHHAGRGDRHRRLDAPTSSTAPCTTASARTARTSTRPSPIPGSRTCQPRRRRRDPRLLKTTPAVHYDAAGQQAAVPAQHPLRGQGLEPAVLASRDSFQPDAEPVGRVEPRRLPRQRPRPLRRLPHAEELARRRQVAASACRAAMLDNWVAPDLTGNARTGLGGWSVDDIAEFLKTGRNAHADAGGSMAEVVDLLDLADERRRPARHRRLPEEPAAPARRRAAPRPTPAAMQARRGDLRRRLRLLPPGERRRPAAALPAARPRRDAAAGRPDRPRCT